MLFLRHDRIARGLSLVEALAGSWRAVASPVESVGVEIVELAIRGGSGALLERRCYGHAQLRDLLRHQVLEAARFERGLELRLAALAEHGVTPTLIKGWAIATRYPSKGLRHYSDLDLVVDPEERAATEAVLARFADDQLAVDLHFGMPHVAGRDVHALKARMQKRALGHQNVRMLGDEDHLWLLALHALGHGLWRSVWLVDLAVLLESRGQGLDWDYLLAGDARDVPAVKISLVLAHLLLGAKVEGTPVHEWIDAMPTWVEPALLEQWGMGFHAYAPIAKIPRASAWL